MKTTARASIRWRDASVALVAFFFGASLPALAQEGHVHTPLIVDASLGWPAVIDAALTAHPRSGELAARTAEASAWERRGHQWLAAAPALYFSYLSDSVLDDVGQREYQTGVELPLWRAGQRSAVRAVAESASVGSAAATAALRLEVAGLLRGALWDIEAAANALAGANEAVDVGEALVRAVERRFARGDLARADLLLAQTALLERKKVVVDLEADVLDAERAYRSLTGLERRPAAFAEARSAHEDFAADHPFVALADAQIARARADLALTEREAKGNATLTIGPRRQVDPFGTIATDSFTVAMRVPVGGKSHGVTQTAHASRLVASAEAERGALLRRLDLDLHEAEHALVVLEETAALAVERRDLADAQARMAETAFAQGEIELRDMLLIQETSLAARREVQRLGIERGRTTAALNQALGEIP
jgi:outer membrane protein, heavy metal efflux system